MPKSLIRKLLNQAPVQYAPDRPGGGLVNGLMTGLRGSKGQQLAAMGSLGTVFSIVDLLSSTVGGLDWDMYRKPPQDGRRVYAPAPGRDDPRVQVVSHAGLALWRKPNPFYDTRLFTEAVQQHFELCGEQVWLVGRDSRVSFPTSLWPVRPDRVEPVPDADEFIGGYVYYGPNGEQVPLKVDQVIRVMRPNPLDVYRGIGTVQAVMTNLDSARYSAQWNRKFFQNDASPGGIIEVPTSLTDTDFKRISRRWREQHQGVNNAHRVAILEMGQWKDSGFSQRDMQFAELTDVSRDILREAWRVHKTLLGLSDDVNLANALTAETVFARGEIVTRANRTKSALNNDLLPMFGSTGTSVEFDFGDPVPENAELRNATLTAQANAFKTLTDAGVHPDDAASTVGLPNMRMASAAVPPVQSPDLQDMPQNSGFSDRDMRELVESFREGMATL